MGTVALITSLIIAVPTSARHSQNASKSSYRSASFIAQHTNGLLRRKCLSTYSSTAGDRGLWLKRHRAAHRAKRGTCHTTPWYVTKQIWAASIIGRESSGDPWPNCPDPYDGGGSWQDTVNCENSGSWLDSPGYYRCGLQFDPGWERRFGRLCP